MTYDKNGNILTRKQTALTASGETTNKVYTYNAINKQLLESVVVTSPSGVTTYQLEYNDFYNPELLIVNNEQKTILYEGKRITRIGELRYLYNNEGIRTIKMCNVYDTHNSLLGEGHHFY